MMNISQDFDKWNELKKTLHESSKRIDFLQRDIWWCHVGQNIGYEQAGKNRNFERPVLVIKKFNKNLFLGVALTSKTKENRYFLQLNAESTAILSQLRVYSSKRLIRKIKRISQQSHPELFASQ